MHDHFKVKNQASKPEKLFHLSTEQTNEGHQTVTDPSCDTTKSGGSS